LLTEVLVRYKIQSKYFMLALIAIVTITTTYTIIMMPYQQIAAQIPFSRERLVKGLLTIDGSNKDLGPSRVAVNPATNMVYVANYDDNTTSAIDGKTNSVVKTIKVGLAPTGVAVNIFTNLIYVTNEDSSTVSVIDGKTNSVVKTIKMA
jgi:YVTN family beta-propeller protein